MNPFIDINNNLFVSEKQYTLIFDQNKSIHPKQYFWYSTII